MQSRPTAQPPVDKEEAALDVQKEKSEKGVEKVTSAGLYSKHRDPNSSTKFGTQPTAPINPVTHFPGRCTR